VDSIEILKVFDKYEQNGEIIRFIYQKEDVSLLKIREILELETSNKNSMEISMILMNKIFEILSPGNDDYEKYSTRCNAIEIITASLEKKIQCNCMMYSVVLSEALLAYGIDSKVIICRPFDFILNTDCHCLVHAFIKEYNKWIVFDPAYNSVYRHSGKFLNIPELRECIITGKKIIKFGFNDKEKNHNEFIKTMAQYLVSFFCLENNHFNCHSNTYNNIHILLPINYKKELNFTTKYNQTIVSFYDKGYWLM